MKSCNHTAALLNKGKWLLKGKFPNADKEIIIKEDGFYCYDCLKKLKLTKQNTIIEKWVEV